MSLKEWVLDGLFPPTCLGCGEDGVWLCDTCFAGIELRTRASCPQCGHYPWSSHFCQGDWPFASFVSMGSYADPVLQKLLRSFKYQRALCLEPIFIDLLESFHEGFCEPLPWKGPSLLISLPMDEDRQRERDLDHASILADLLHQLLIPHAERRSILTRTRRALPNARLTDPTLRAANMRGIFSLVEPTSLPVILVDDVCTTGATACEAARLLLASGVPEVHLMTFASGVKRSQDKENPSGT